MQLSINQTALFFVFGRLTQVFQTLWQSAYFGGNYYEERL